MPIRKKKSHKRNKSSFSLSDSVYLLEVKDEVQLAHLFTYRPKISDLSPQKIQVYPTPYIPKVAIQNFDIAMNDFQGDQFVVVLVDTDHEEQTCVSREGEVVSRRVFAIINASVTFYTRFFDLVLTMIKFSVYHKAGLSVYFTFVLQKVAHLDPSCQDQLSGIFDNLVLFFGRNSDKPFRQTNFTLTTDK